jgi:hypothetical protein
VIVVDVTALVGLKLHDASEGKFVHPAVIVILVAANPFWDVNVSRVDPACPGALTVIAVGFAVTENVGPFTLRVAEPAVVAAM